MESFVLWRANLQLERQSILGRTLCFGRKFGKAGFCGSERRRTLMPDLPAAEVFYIVRRIDRCRTSIVLCEVVRKQTVHDQIDCSRWRLRKRYESKLEGEI